MNSRNGIIGLMIVAVVVIGAIVLIQETNEGPLEEAAEDVDEAVEELSDDIDNNSSESSMEQFRF
jgi:hypothetical protein